MPKKIIAIAIGLFPGIAFAQSGINLNAIKPYSEGIINLINSILVPIVIAIAFIVFLWGVYKYFILGAANDTERATGRKFVLWGVIGFVIIFSLWGLIAILRSFIPGLTGTSSAPNPPTIFNGSSQQNQQPPPGSLNI